MKPYSKQDVQDIYHQLMNMAQTYGRKSDWANALACLESSARWAYEFNFIYRDDEGEKLLKHIADQNLEHVKIEKQALNRCAFLDSWCESNRGLTQQYLRAMMATGMEILYISVAPTLSNGEDTINELKNYENATFMFFDHSDMNAIGKAKKISKALADFSPHHVFLHIAPFETAILMACHSLSGATICNVNLTDHAFWMGASIIDYNFEFRPYGETVSIEKRGLKESQLIRLPYYPVKPLSRGFEGFPKLPSDCIKVFTGGALYKMIGKDDIFFKLMDSILSISSKVVIIVAGFSKDAGFDNKCALMNHGDRVIQIGVRSDIDAVFDNVDIYFGTYPMCGGLMSQYAARHGLPIIAYHDKGDVMNYVEEIVNHYQNQYKSFSTIEDMIVYADRLISDEAFRKQEGLLLKNGLMTAEKFKIEFKKAITIHKSSWTPEKDEIDYNAFFERYLDLENSNGYTASKQLARTLKIKVLKIKGHKQLFCKILIKLCFDKIKRFLG